MELSSFQLLQLMLAYIFGVKYTSRRKKALEGEEKSSLSKKFSFSLVVDILSQQKEKKK